jgi:long-chain fatty acid transport protein
MQPTKTKGALRLPNFLLRFSLAAQKLVLLGACGLLFVVAPIHSWAGGLYITEFGTPSMGVANAGSGAIGNDASAAWHNPASMTRLSGTHVQGALGYLVGNVKFDADSNTPVPGGDGGEAGEDTPILNGSVVHSLTDKLKVGFSLGSVAGAGLDYKDSWAGRQQATEVQLLTLTAIPSIAYKQHWLSVGVGLTVNYGNLDTFELRAPNPAQSKVEIDGDDFEYGFVGGVLVEFSDQTRMSVRYLSETDYKFDGDIKVSGGALGGLQANSDLEITFPQMVEVHFYHEINDQFAILAQADWEDWSSFEDIPLTVGTAGSGAIPRNWDDTYKLGGGFHYRPAPAWLVQTGFAWDSNPVDKKDRTADMPVDRQLRFAVGTQYQWSDRLNVGLNFTYINLGDAEIKSSNLRGDYRRNELFITALNASWKF